MNAMVGREGLEKSFEEYLHGTDGTRSIETDISGKITNVIEGEAPQPGNNVITTLDLDLQKAAEGFAGQYVVGHTGRRWRRSGGNGREYGEVLAMASYPTIDLTQWNEMYSIWAEDEENTPLLNRAIQGAYQPGSTYKPLTAICGPGRRGVIDENTLIDCKHYYDRFQSRTYKCMGNHGPSDVLRAIQNRVTYSSMKPAICWAAKKKKNGRTNLALAKRPYRTGGVNALVRHRSQKPRKHAGKQSASEPLAAEVTSSPQRSVSVTLR